MMRTFFLTAIASSKSGGADTERTKNEQMMELIAERVSDDEEKAKLIRSEAEKVEQANGEMAASLDYLKLPNSLNVLKGGLDSEMSLDPEFERWCQEMSSHGSFSTAFDQL